MENLYNDEPHLYGGTETIINLAENGRNIRLTSAEIGNLWSQYLWDSMAICFLHHFADNVKDAEIRVAVEYALELSQKHTGRIKNIFKMENIPVPVGFTERDVYIKAPRLFSDSLYLYYLSYMAKNGMMLYAQILGMSSRSDIRSFYNECLDSIRELDNKTTGILLSKGLYIRPPYFSVPEEVDFVEKQSFLGSYLGSKRTPHAIEISHLFFNMQRNELGKAILMGFSHVAQSKEIKDYFLTGKEIAHKHIKIFSSLMGKDDTPTLIIRNTKVTDSTTPPFSDKIMLYHTTFLTSVSSSFYGIAMGVSSRKDITASYARLTAEVLKYAGKGINIMINNGWMEEPLKANGRNSPDPERH